MNHKWRGEWKRTTWCAIRCFTISLVTTVFWFNSMTVLPSHNLPMCLPSLLRASSCRLYWSISLTNKILRNTQRRTRSCAFFDCADKVKHVLYGHDQSFEVCRYFPHSITKGIPLFLMSLTLICFYVYQRSWRVDCWHVYVLRLTN